MKPKNLHGTRGRPARGKAVKKEVHSQNVVTLGHQYESGRPSVEITKCISYQKFRYSGENRPGKKYQEKEFMELKLSNLNDRVVRIVIICTDAENKELIHPNGLVGKDCHDGIYDKEYAITRSDHELKIPYLRTERIKTKKNESCNIQGVLEMRASHLPSPYKERCLSQCNDKYTSTRKFDTTKVCLGVIVTTVSHQGTFNGSLHAISHVVRNASEKTTLGILKLSQPYISALEGGFIDIFTTEHGPEIEEGKYYVYVTCEDDMYGQWRSESITAEKGEILYKRIITYKAPPFALCPNITSPVKATLNLECPQSNQYCSYDLVYRPEGDRVLSEAISNEIKRSISDSEDGKPSPKKFKAAEVPYNVEQASIVKANLRSRIKAQQAGNYHEAAKDGSNGNNVPNESAVISKTPGLRDLSVEDSSAYGELARPSNTNGVSIIDSSNTTIMKGQVIQGNASSSEGHPEIEVVATGYSDEVPPDTVLIYTTTDGISGQPMAEVRENQVILREIPERQNQLLNVHMQPEEVIEYVKDPKKGGFHILTPQENSHVLSTLHHNISQIQVVDNNANNSISKMTQISGSNGQIGSSATVPFVISSSTPCSVSASDSIIRRMVVPSGKHENSPWEVAREEDNLAAYLFPSQSNSSPQKTGSQAKISVQNIPFFLDGQRTQVTDSNRSSNPIEANVLPSDIEGKLNDYEGITLKTVDLQGLNLGSITVSEIARKFESSSLTALEPIPTTKDEV